MTKVVKIPEDPLLLLRHTCSDSYHHDPIPLQQCLIIHSQIGYTCSCICVVPDL